MRITAACQILLLIVHLSHENPLEAERDLQFKARPQKTSFLGATRSLGSWQRQVVRGRLVSE